MTFQETQKLSKEEVVEKLNDLGVVFDENTQIMKLKSLLAKETQKREESESDDKEVTSEAKEPAEEPKEQTPETATKEEVEERVSMTKTELQEFIRQAVKEERHKLKTVEPHPEVEGKDSIGLDDYMEKPVHFFARDCTKMIHSYKYKGREMIPPIRRIKFETFTKKYFKGRNGADVIAVCRFSTNSKSEAEYIKNHPEYNVTIFESHSDAHQVLDSDISDFKTYHKQVSNLKPAEVVRRVKEAGLPVMEDDTLMREQLIRHLVEMAKDGRKKKQLSEHMKGSIDNPNVHEPGQVQSDYQKSGNVY